MKLNCLQLTIQLMAQNCSTMWWCYINIIEAIKYLNLADTSAPLIAAIYMHQTNRMCELYGEFIHKVHTATLRRKVLVYSLPKYSYD